MKNTFRNIIFVTISVLLIGIISACSNSFSNEVSNPDSGNLNNQNLGSATVRMFVPDYAAMAEKSENRAIAPQTAYVQISGYNSVSNNWNVFQRIEFSSAVKIPVENSPENFPGNIFTITFDKVVAKAYQVGELKIELLNSAGSIITSGTNATSVTVQYGGSASTTFYTVPYSDMNNDSNLVKGEMKFMRYIMNANTHYTLHLDVEGSSYPDVVVFNENGNFEKYISVDSAESSRIEFTETSKTVKYIGVWADDGVAVSNYKLNLYTDLTDFTFKDSSIGFWGGEEYQVNLTPIPSDSYLGKATYISSNPDITVNEDGLISGNIEAEGTITVSYNGISHSIAVNVYETATELTGVLSGEKLHWTKENSPYKVTGDVLVEENDQLVIEPGVKVYFVGNNYIKMNGSIYAVGTKDEPITITKAASYNGSWIGLRIGGGSFYTTDTYTYNSGNILKYVNFSYAQTPVELNRPVFVDHCNFTDCYSSVSVNDGSVLINNNFENGISISSPGNIITNNRIKNSFWCDWGAGFTASNNTFENCSWRFEGYNSKSFVNNIFKGGTLNLGSDYYDRLRFQNNNFENFTGLMLNITGDHDSHKTIDFKGNYWGETQTAELIANEATGEKNVSFIRDYRDDFNLTEVDYTGWKREPVEGAGYLGNKFIDFELAINGLTNPDEPSEADISVTARELYAENTLVSARFALSADELATATWGAMDQTLTLTRSKTKDGFATVYAQTKDNNGNLSPVKTLKVAYDDPSIEIMVRQGDEYRIISERHEVSGDLKESKEIYVRGIDNGSIAYTELSINGSVVSTSEYGGCSYYLIPYLMPAGEYLLTAKVRDSVNNETTATRTLVIKRDVNKENYADSNYDSATGQLIKDEKTAYLWHFDGDTKEADGADFATLGKNWDRTEIYSEYAKMIEGGINGAASRVYGGYNEIPLNSNSFAFSVEYWQKGENWNIKIEKSELFRIYNYKRSKTSYDAYNYLYYAPDEATVTNHSIYFGETNKKSDSDWHYYVHVFTETYMAVYKDGQLMTYQTFSKVNLNTEGNTNNLIIEFGEHEGTCYDELRVSTCARTPDEIKAYYDVAASLYDSGN